MIGFESKTIIGTPLLVALLLVYKTLASNKKVAFLESHSLEKRRPHRFLVYNGRIKCSGKVFLQQLALIGTRKFEKRNQNNVLFQAKLYRGVMEDVIKNVRESFLNEGVDEQVLQELKQVLWGCKDTRMFQKREKLCFGIMSRHYAKKEWRSCEIKGLLPRKFWPREKNNY